MPFATLSIFTSLKTREIIFPPSDNDNKKTMATSPLRAFVIEHRPYCFVKEKGCFGLNAIADLAVFFPVEPKSSTQQTRHCHHTVII
jgi:hypothetical protein